MSEFKPGEVVQLKSGGPLMTITGRRANDGRQHCFYFADNELKEVFVEPAALSKYSE